MGERILVPYDGTPLSEAALERVLTTHPDAEVTVLYVVDPLMAVYEAEISGPVEARSWVDRATAEAETICAEAEGVASEHGRTVRTATETGRPARTIVAYADDHDIDHIVVGSHGRKGASRLLLGSVAEAVVRRSPASVTVVR